jgi:serine/threonine-protein kinase RCK2
MSTIQNLKNFIRHGKQARGAEPPRDQPTTNVSPVHAHQQQTRHHGQAISDPNLGRQNQHYQQQQPLPGEYSVGAVDHRNIVAQAGHAAANAAGHGQKIQNQGREAELQQIINEEREQKGKLPKYPGLERYLLLEKMGDGAFSNVYRARDTQQQGEVAIKVVRKFEMNANQVRPACGTGLISLSLVSEFDFLPVRKSASPTMNLT